MEALSSLETCTKIYGATFQKTELFVDMAEGEPEILRVTYCPPFSWSCVWRGGSIRHENPSLCYPYYNGERCNIRGCCVHSDSLMCCVLPNKALRDCIPPPNEVGGTTGFIIRERLSEVFLFCLIQNFQTFFVASIQILVRYLSYCNVKFCA